MGRGRAEFPDIYHYLNYRDYLRDLVQYEKDIGLYSTRRFAHLLGFKNPNFIKLIVDGKKHLSEEKVNAVAKVFRLKKKETEFFKTLVALDQAKTLDDKNSIYQNVLASKRFQEQRTTAASEYEYFKHWYSSVIIVALSTTWRTLPPKEMAASLGISESNLIAALSHLETLKLIEKVGKYWSLKNSMVQPAPEIESLHVRNFHREMIHKAQEAIDGVDHLKRNLIGVTLSLSEDEFQEFKKKTWDFLSEQYARYASSKVPQAVYQINFQLFPILSLLKK